MATGGYQLTDSGGGLLLPSGSTPTVEGVLVNESGQAKPCAFTNGIAGWFPKMIFSNTSSRTQAGIVTAVTLIPASYIGTLVLPANFFKVGKRVRFIMRGQYTTDGAPGNATIAWKIGATTWRTIGSFGLDNSVTNGYWRMEGAIACRTTGVGGTVSGTTTWEHETTSGPGNPFHVEPPTSYADVALDTTASHTLNCVWTATDAGTSISCHDLVIWEEC